MAKETRASKERLSEPQVRILEALAKENGPLTRKEIHEKTKVDLPSLGAYAGYKDRTINDRSCHSGNLFNRGYVRLSFPKDVNGRKVIAYEITSDGLKALSEAR